MKALAAGTVIAFAVAAVALFWASSEGPNTGPRSIDLRPNRSGERPSEVGDQAPPRGRRSEGDAAPSIDQQVLEQLVARVASLESRLAQLEGAGVDVRESVASLENAESSDAEVAGPSDRSPTPGRPWFHGASLESLGFTPSEVQRIRETWEYTVMESLELETDRLRNGEKGWWAAIRDQEWIENQARETLGDSGYDAMLYAGGSKNRVILSELIDDSPGAAAGIEAGDQLISYGGQRVFHPRALKRLTTGGAAGELVEIRVQRAGQPVRIFMPRGPIGARIVAESHAPLR